MEKFCVITNSIKDKAESTACYIQDYLLRAGKQCVVTRDLPECPGQFTDLNEIPSDTECVIIVGGDGTLIQAAVDLRDWDVPLVGINLGTLGFLTEVEEQHIDQALCRLVEDDFQVETRMMMEGTVSGGEEEPYTEYSLNDIIISRSGFCSLIAVNVYLNGMLIDSFSGDGVLVCTPTGSTGYNLSAGGPVIAPETQMFTITPICPHSLNKRSFVVSAQDTVTLELCQRKEGVCEDAVVSFDGRIRNSVKVGERVDIRRAAGITKLIKLTDMNFFDILRSKLNK